MCNNYYSVDKYQSVLLVYIVSKLIVESYQNLTINTILDDIAKKYKIDTSKDHLSEDMPVREIKFKYRTYSECVRMLYKSVGYLKEIQALTFISLMCPVVQFCGPPTCACKSFFAFSSDNFSAEIYPHLLHVTM